MRLAQEMLEQEPGVPPERIAALIRGWRRLAEELIAVEVAQEELATLYEINRALNSSLDLTETLGRVMDSLIRLTGAERGCLMLVDDSGNLELQAARNFGHEDIAPSDLELSHTVVQSVVETGEPVVTTNAQSDPRFSAEDSVIGYSLRSIACVPLRVRDQVIGALYLDNRIRSGVFSQKDLPALTAFANEAAVAIENARLYTRTDQALAARVEELMTLQQIDRELNASLDLERVLDLTLSWALQATGADAGAVSLLEEDGTIRTVSHAGNGKDPNPGAEALHRALASREPVTIDGTRMLVPIRWEDQAVGLLDLQHHNDAVFLPDHVKFAGRLADHAAVAIENAHLYRKVRQADRAKTEFISFVAHELRTPMTSIRGYADLLRKGIGGPLAGQQDEFVQTIISNVERMQVLVSDLQDVSRIESGQLRLEITETALADALESALQATRAQIEARSQHLTLEVPESLPPACADPARLTQILINLLSNAYKYTAEGGHIGVRAWQQDDFIYCSVSDTGIGMSPEDQAHLFTKFFRSSDPRVQEAHGTGLGLCIVKSLVELQGGSLEVESQLGEGTTFTFTVPIAVPVAADEQPPR